MQGISDCMSHYATRKLFAPYRSVALWVRSSFGRRENKQPVVRGRRAEEGVEIDHDRSRLTGLRTLHGKQSDQHHLSV